MKNVITLIIVLISTITFAQQNELKNLTPDMVNQNSVFTKENTKRGKAVRAFKAGTALPAGCYLEYTAVPKLVSFSKLESRSGLSDGAYMLPVGTPVLNIDGVRHYPYCGNRFSTFTNLPTITNTVTEVKIEKEIEYVPVSVPVANNQTTATQTHEVNTIPCEEIITTYNGWVKAYQNHNDIYVKGVKVTSKYQFLKRMYQEIQQTTSCGALVLMPNRNNDGVKVAAVAGPFVGFGLGYIFGKSKTKRVVEKVNEVWGPNDSGNEVWGPNDSGNTNTGSENNNGNGSGVETWGNKVAQNTTSTRTKRQSSFSKAFNKTRW